jgi:hypothetical protein
MYKTRNLKKEDKCHNDDDGWQQNNFRALLTNQSTQTPDLDIPFIFFLFFSCVYVKNLILGRRRRKL